jgi:hypothetical protein
VAVPVSRATREAISAVRPEICRAAELISSGMGVDAGQSSAAALT